MHCQSVLDDLLPFLDYSFMYARKEGCRLVLNTASRAMSILLALG